MSYTFRGTTVGAVDKEPEDPICRIFMVIASVEKVTDGMMASVDFVFSYDKPRIESLHPEMLAMLGESLVLHGNQLKSLAEADGEPN